MLQLRKGEANDHIRDELRNEIEAHNGAKRQIRIKDRKIEDLNKVIARLEKQVAELDGDNNELRDTIRALKREVHKLEKERRDAAKYVAKLESNLAEGGEEK